MSIYITIYLIGTGLMLVISNTILLYHTIKLNEVPEWKVIVEQWAWSVAWPLFWILLIEIRLLEAVRFALKGKHPDD